MHKGKILIIDDEASCAGLHADALCSDGYTVESAGDGPACSAKANEIIPDIILSGKDGIYRIMIVEDDEKMADLYRLILMHEGYDCILAGSAEEAISLLEKQSIDLIMLDLMLPDLNGIELLKIIRNNHCAAIRDIPIIMASVNSDTMTKVTAIDIGADDYLVKPIHRAEMLARIRANIRKLVVRKKLEEERAMYFHDAVTDPLTKLYNRHYFKTVMDHAIAACNRFDELYCLLLIDVDGFKNINDSMGHVVGDTVLRELGKLILVKSRNCDVAVRYGGDEFVILLRGSDLEGASCSAERVRIDIESLDLEDVGAKKVTVSIGITKIRQVDTCLEEIIRRADYALYEAKKSGKNRICTESAGPVQRLPT